MLGAGYDSPGPPLRRPTRRATRIRGRPTAISQRKAWVIAAKCQSLPTPGMPGTSRRLRRSASEVLSPPLPSGRRGLPCVVWEGRLYLTARRCVDRSITTRRARRMANTVPPRTIRRVRAEPMATMSSNRCRLPFRSSSNALFHASVQRVEIDEVTAGGLGRCRARPSVASRPDPFSDGYQRRRRGRACPCLVSARYFAANLASPGIGGARPVLRPLRGRFLGVDDRPRRAAWSMLASRAHGGNDRGLGAVVGAFGSQQVVLWRSIQAMRCCTFACVCAGSAPSRQPSRRSRADVHQRDENDSSVVD